MEMPKVKRCVVEECSYNRNMECHALAITVGDGLEALCDTYWPGGVKGGDEQAIAGVGACRAEECKFNNSLECDADGIEITEENHKACCQTYVRR